MQTLQITRKNHIIWAEINRLETNNAINFEVMAELETILDEIENDPRIRVFILSGSGDEFFVSGGDLKNFAFLKTEEEGFKMADRMAGILKRIENGEFWSIACINGDAYGGGCEMILAFDFSIARKTAKLFFTQRDFCLPPGWGGLTRMVERVGRSKTLEWLGSSATIPADVAYSGGLINRLSITSDLRMNTWNWAEKLSKMSRELISCLKTGSRLTLEGERSESFDYELRQFGRFWAHEDHHRKAADFLKKNEE